MTKKDYVLIAEAIKQGVEISEDKIKMQTLKIVDCLSEALKKDNPNFDKVKFNQYMNFPYYGEK